MPLGRPITESDTSAHRRSWLWAVVVVGSIGVVLLVTLVAHALADRARMAQETVAAPALPVMSVAAVAHPEAGALLVAYDPASGHLVTLASQSEPFCPPVGPCQTVRPDALALLDGTSGQPLARTLLTGDAAAAANATLLLDDPVRQRAYATAPDVVVLFSTANGAVVGHYTLSSGSAWSGGALDPAHNRLYLVGGGRVVMLDAATGTVLASATLPMESDAPAPDGPVFDASRMLLDLVIRPKTANETPFLLQLDATTLKSVTTINMPSGARLGPLDTATGSLDIFGGDSRAWQFHAALASAGSLTRAPALDGALAVGANPQLGHRYLAGFTRTLTLDERSGSRLAALPLVARWPMSRPLPVDGARGLLYLPADHGAIVIVRDSPASVGSKGISSASSAILARAAMATLLPDTNQDPPFVAPGTFPLGGGTPAKPETRAQDYWIYFADRGWQGAYPGTASTAVTQDSTRPGGYLVTFTITWRQLFQRTHTWVCTVAPNGGVALRSETGDTVP